MQITFRKVEIHNFMSFGDEVFDIEKYDGLNIVRGINADKQGESNGVGKSTLFNSIVYGLYGQSPVKVKTENVANRALDDKEVRVAVYLNVNGTEYKAVTGQNKRSQSYFQLSTIENGNEKDITRSSIAETRDFFEKDILHCDLSLFLRTIILTSAQDYNFFMLKSAAKKEFIENLFDIGVFGDMYTLIHRDALNLEKEIVGLQNQLIVFNGQKESYVAKIAEFERQKEEKIAYLTAELSRLEKELAEKKGKTVDRNVDLLNKCTSALNQCNDVKAKLDAAYRTVVTEESKATSEISSCNSAISERQKIISKHSDLRGKLCDDCKKIFSGHYNLGTYEEEIEAAKKRLATAEERLASLKEKKKKVNDETTKIAMKMETIKAKIAELNHEYVVQTQEIRRYENAVTAKKSELEVTSKMENNYVLLSRSNDGKIEEIQEKLGTMLTRIKYLKKAEGIVSQENIRKFIIRDLLGLINGMVKSYLSKMLASYDCIFDEDFDYRFVTETGECELGNFSNGERMKLSLAVNFAFRDFMAQRSAISSNILFVDEYLDSAIDTMTLQSVIGIFRDYIRLYHQNVFIISHRAELANEEFDHTILVEKRDEISRLK